METSLAEYRRDAEPPAADQTGLALSPFGKRRKKDCEEQTYYAIFVLICLSLVGLLAGYLCWSFLPIMKSR